MREKRRKWNFETYFLKSVSAVFGTSGFLIWGSRIQMFISFTFEQLALRKIWIYLFVPQLRFKQESLYSLTLFGRKINNLGNRRITLNSKPVERGSSNLSLYELFHVETAIVTPCFFWLWFYTIYREPTDSEKNKFWTYKLK